MADLVTVALNEIRALQREIQGLKNQNAALDRRVRYLEAVTDGNGQGQKVTDARNGRPQTVTDNVTDAPKVTDAVTDKFPRWVSGTHGRGIQYELSDGSVINAGKVKALAAEAQLHG